MDFDEFWGLYPKKVGKKDAEKCYSRLSADEKRHIADTLPKRVRTDANWREGKFIPNPSTYLNQGRWHDEYKKAPAFAEINIPETVDTFCKKCEAHTQSHRHDQICNKNEPFYHGEIGGKRYFLGPAGAQWL